MDVDVDALGITLVLAILTLIVLFVDSSSGLDLHDVLVEVAIGDCDIPRAPIEG